MFSKALSAAVYGIDGVIVCVEADVSDGLPLFELVGYLGSEVRESRERVRISLKNSGFHLPAKRITVNLSPADLRKEGTAFDLPIAIAILTSFGIIPIENLENTLFIGELSLNGDIKKINGVLPIVYTALKEGFKRCIVPASNVREGAVVQGIDVYGMDSLKDTVDFLNNKVSITPCLIDNEDLFKWEYKKELDYSEVTGQELAKRAIEIAVSGMHNLLMVGPPGSGKTMLAKRIPSIMPELTFAESLEISKIYSVSGLLDDNTALINKRPFRSPHHTITATALAGGGRIPTPGEISLAHLGVLFLDEFPEFNKNAIEILRQPLEDNEVTIARLQGTYRYPADMMLVAAMNPCNCGYYPDRNHCNCTLSQVRRYLNKISGPLLDRIDISVETLQIDYQELELYKRAESSEEIRARVRKARDIQLNRYKDENIYFNSQLTPKSIQKYCNLGKEEKELIKKVFAKMNLSARAYHRILKVARTIADLDGLKEIKTKHLSEALCYRNLEKKYWEEGK